jgi:antitoxin component YwqK of YwqJK toxin-antitoxin module
MTRYFFMPMPKHNGMKEEEVERTFHRNGRVFQEVPFVGGEINGVLREWHRNGVLAKEVPMKDGLRHGICKQWNDKGELLGTFEMNMGTGLSKQWFPNGQIEFEASIVGEKFTGRMRRWDEEAHLVQETFFQGNKMVSKEDYQRAVEAAPSLPSFIHESGDQPTAVTKSKGRRSGHERIIARLLSTRTANALEWLNTNSPESAKTLGKMNATKSVAFATALKGAGAVEVLAVDIDEDRAGNENADKLVIFLPTDQTKRQAIRKYCARRKCEISPEKETGHSHLAVFLG